MWQGKTTTASSKHQQKGSESCKKSYFDTRYVFLMSAAPPGTPLKSSLAEFLQSFRWAVRRRGEAKVGEGFEWFGIAFGRDCGTPVGVWVLLEPNHMRYRVIRRPTKKRKQGESLWKPLNKPTSPYENPQSKNPLDPPNNPNKTSNLKETPKISTSRPAWAHWKPPKSFGPGAPKELVTALGVAAHELPLPPPWKARVGWTPAWS